MGNVKIFKVKIVAWSIALRRLIIILQKKVSFPMQDFSCYRILMSLQFYKLIKK